MKRILARDGDSHWATLDLHLNPGTVSWQGDRSLRAILAFRDRQGRWNTTVHIGYIDIVGNLDKFQGVQAISCLLCRGIP